MAVKIRLAREGRHQLPFYRVVVADSRYTRDGRYIENLGTYDPKNGINGANLNEEATIKWLVSGAQYSDTIKGILSAKGLIAKAKEEKAKTAVKKVKNVSTAAKKEAK